MTDNRTDLEALEVIPGSRTLLEGIEHLVSQGDLVVAKPPATRKRTTKKREMDHPANSEVSDALQLQDSSGHPLDHHQRRCTICHHPDRDAIEEEFIHWHSVREIAFGYEVERRSLYRHAHAFDLFAVRDTKLRFALGHIINRAEHVRVTSDSIIRAIHAFARLDNSGQWIEPPKHVFFSSIREADPPLIAAQPNRHTKPIENRRKPLKTKRRARC
jgi:hypothetical protein